MCRITRNSTTWKLGHGTEDSSWLGVDSETRYESQTLFGVKEVISQSSGPSQWITETRARKKKHSLYGRGWGTTLPQHDTSDDWDSQGNVRDGGVEGRENPKLKHRGLLYSFFIRRERYSKVNKFSLFQVSESFRTQCLSVGPLTLGNPPRFTWDGDGDTSALVRLRRLNSLLKETPYLYSSILDGRSKSKTRLIDLLESLRDLKEYTCKDSTLHSLKPRRHGL